MFNEHLDVREKKFRVDTGTSDSRKDDTNLWGPILNLSRQGALVLPIFAGYFQLKWVPSITDNEVFLYYSGSCLYEGLAATCVAEL